MAQQFLRLCARLGIKVSIKNGVPFANPRSKVTEEMAAAMPHIRSTIVEMLEEHAEARITRPPFALKDMQRWPKLCDCGGEVFHYFAHGERVYGECSACYRASTSPRSPWADFLIDEGHMDGS